MKLYISGPMSGFKNHNFYEFFKKEKEIQNIFKCEIINPAYTSLKLCNKLNKNIDEVTYDEYLSLDIETLKSCDAIYMLKGWKNSKGAQLELEYAKKLGLNVIYEDME